MHPQSKIAEWCDHLLEYGWLLCIALIPSYFNLLSARHFEPDKAVVFRALVSMLIAVAAVGSIGGLPKNRLNPQTLRSTHYWATASLRTVSYLCLRR
jgi:hypothetical protein